LKIGNKSTDEESQKVRKNSQIGGGVYFFVKRMDMLGYATKIEDRSPTGKHFFS
jgi:hypothetical protein